MTVGANDRVSDDQAINRLLGDVFQAMEGAGDEVLRPFYKMSFNLEVYPKPYFGLRFPVL